MTQNEIDAIMQDLEGTPAAQIIYQLNKELRKLTVDVEYWKTMFEKAMGIKEK